MLLKQCGIEFEEVMVRFDSFDAGSRFKQTIAAVNPAGKVPVLDDDGLIVWDSLAIAEYLAEKLPEKNLWPQDRRARAGARSACAEMHSGFSALRAACPMNIEAKLPDVGAQIWRDKPAVQADVQRLVALWRGLLAQHGGPLLFGQFSIADAFFAPVCFRIVTYVLPVPPDVAAYVERVRALRGVQAWVEGALAEKDFRAFEEPFRVKPD